MKPLLLLFFFIAEFIWAAEFNVPLNEFEQPDLSGVWNFNDSTPFERPENFGQREFLSEEELADRKVRLCLLYTSPSPRD